MCESYVVVEDSFCRVATILTASWGFEFPCLQTIDVQDTQREFSHDVLVTEAKETSFIIGDESNEPYPVPTIKIKVDPEAGPFPVDVNTEGRIKKTVAGKLAESANVTMNLNEPAIPESGSDKDSFVSETRSHAEKFVSVPAGPNVALQPIGNAVPSTWIAVPNSASAGAKLVMFGLMQSASWINNDAATMKSKHRVIEPSARNKVDQ